MVGSRGSCKIETHSDCGMALISSKKTISFLIEATACRMVSVMLPPLALWGGPVAPTLRPGEENARIR